MQNSSTMLDSTLGKILTAGNVDKSPESQDAKVNETIIPDPLTEGTEKAVTIPTPEAEVRLVFRFSVEEHLIYRGRVERVQQLQSEELSRLVSRVAWNGAKDSENKSNQKKDKSTYVDDTNLEPKKQNNEHNHRSLSTQTNETSFSPQHILTLEINCNAPTTSTESTEISATSLESNKQFSHHGTSLLPASPSPKLTKDCSPAQNRKLIRPTTETINECDNSTARKSSNHIREEIIKPCSQIEIPTTESSPKLTKQIGTKPIDLDYNSSNVTGLQSTKEPEPQSNINIDLVDIQTIAGTLKECLDSVDYELKNSNFNTTSNNQQSTINLLSTGFLDKMAVKNNSQLSDSFASQNSIQRAIEYSRISTDINDANTKVIPEISYISGNNKGEKTQESSRNQSHSTYSHQFEKLTSDDISLETTNYENNEEIIIPPPNVKRTTTSDASSSSKKVRKVISKDLRNLSSTRKPTPKMSNAGLTSKQIELSSPISTTDTELDHNQMTDESGRKISQARFTNKIFAKWTDNHYYPGTILRQAKDRKFVIGFLDGAQRNVAKADLIPLSSIQGRQVRVSIAKNYCVNALVHDESSPVNDQPMFDVEYQQDGLIRKCVPFKDIFLTCDQGGLLINQVDKNTGGSNFADVDLDNIIYEKRSRRLQDMEDYELTENPTTTGKKKRGKYNIRNSSSKSINNAPVSSTSPDSTAEGSPASIQSKRNSQNDNIISNDSESTDSPDPLKTNFQCPNSNVSESSSSTGSSNVNALEIGQEFYFGTSSPHRTKTSLLL